ncbi:MAG: hypothetical protein NTW28_25105 [Candidatus Solibacter sp.]|nr:hypothetical protein [Candidatus Solibacter sp.]
MASAGSAPWRKFAFALLILAYFLYFNWDGLWAQFAADDMMNMSIYWKLPTTRIVLDLFTPWRGAYRPMGSLFYLPLLQFAGLNPLPYHAAMLGILLGNLYLIYRFARRVGCGELQAGLATLVVAYHAGLSVLYYSTAFIYDVLCFSFYMSAFLCYARVRAQGRRLSGRETALVMGLYLLALDSKEMALTLPIVLLAYEWIHHRPKEWTPGEIVRWLLGPGRVMLYCVALNLFYLYGKAFGPDALLQSPAYRAELSLQRLFAFEKAAMGDLFLAWGSFSWRGVVAVWLLLAYLAWRRQRPVLRFCWVFLMFTPLPLAVLEGRGGGCLYIPLAGWAVFAAVVLTDVAGAAARFLAAEPVFRRAGYAGLFAALLCATFFFWAQENDHQKRRFVRAAMADVGRLTGATLDKLRALNPHVKPGTHVAFLNDPFDDWDMLFIAELWFRDKSLQFHLQRKVPLPPEELAKMTVFDFRDGRLVQVTGGGSRLP